MLLYGVGIWLLWTSVVIAAAEVLPASATGSPLFASSKVSLVLVLVVVAALRLPRRVAISRAWEAAAVGVVWAFAMIAMDLGHALMEPYDIGQYLIHYAPAYLVVPVLTTLVGTRTRTRGPVLDAAAASTAGSPR
jgi:hypothetical protein